MQSVMPACPECMKPLTNVHACLLADVPDSIVYAQMFFKVFNGYRPPLPDSMPAGMQKLMEACWSHNPQRGPPSDSSSGPCSALSSRYGTWLLTSPRPSCLPLHARRCRCMAANAWYGGPAVGCWRHHRRGLIAADSVPRGTPSYTHAHSHMMPLSQFDLNHSTAVPSRQPGTQILLWSCSDILVIGSGSSLPGLGLFAACISSASLLPSGANEASACSFI